MTISDPNRAQLDEGRVLTRAVLSAAGQLGLSNKALSEIIGVSEATVSRMGSGTYTLAKDGKAFELAIQLVRLFRSLDTLVGGDGTVARSWLNNDNTALGAKPVQKLKTISGLFDVIAYLDARRAVI